VLLVDIDVLGVDLYNSAYANYGSDVYRQVSTETYGQDFGKTSWVTMEESNEIPQYFVGTRFVYPGAGMRIHVSG